MKISAKALRVSSVSYTHLDVYKRQVIDADIDSNDGSLIAGILADWVNGGTVENCYTSGKLENNVGSKFVGGLIGQCTCLLYTSCY